MFKLKMDSTVLMVDGTEAKFPENPLTLRSVVVTALVKVAEGDQFLPVEARAYRTELATRAQRQDTLALSLADVVSLTPLIVRSFTSPLVLNTWLRMLEDSVKSVPTVTETPPPQE